MRLLANLALAGVVLSALAQGAASAEECTDAPTIVALSTAVIEKRTALPPILARRYGAEPAFLILHYGDIDEAEAAAMLDDLVAARVHNAQDLAFARTIARKGIDAVGDEAYEDAMSITGVSTARALLLNGGAERLFAEIAKRENPVNEYRTAMIAIVDQPDTVKARLVELASASGQPLLAAGIAATYSEPMAWESFAGTLDAATLTRAQDLWRWVPAMVGQPELPRSTPPADPAITMQMHNLMITAALEPEFDFLLTLSNITGRIAEVSAVGDMLREAITTGTIDRRGTFDRAWLMAYRALLKSWGNVPELRGLLSDITQPDGRVDRVSALDALQWIDAVDALTPYVRGETDVAPEPPSEVSFVWPRWLAAAQAVRAGGVPELTDDTVARIAELMHVKGAEADLATAIAASSPSADLLEVAADIAKRLDRECDAALQHPTEALQLPGQPIFKFD